MAWGRKPKWSFEDAVECYPELIMPRPRTTVAEFLAQRREEDAEAKALEAYFKEIKEKEKEKSKVKEATAQEKRELALIMFLLSPIPGFAILHMLAFMYHHLPKF